MDEGDNVVNEVAESTAQVESTTTEQTPEDTFEATEKSEITQEETEEGSLEEESKTVPYDRFKEVNAKAKEADELRAQLEQYKGQQKVLERFQRAFQEEERDPTLKRADEQLQDLKYTREDQVREIAEQVVAQRQTGDKFMAEAEALESKYNGEDGSPKFVTQDVVDYLDRKGYKPQEFMSGKITLEDAYFLMHRDSVVDARAKQKRGTAPSEKPGKPMSSQGTTGKADFDEAKKTGDWAKVLYDRVGSPFKS